MSTEMIEFKKLIAPDILSCPDPIVNREVVSVLLEFCKKTNILQQEFEMEMDSTDIDLELQNSVDFDLSEFVPDLRLVSLLEIMVDSTPYIPYKRNIQNTITNYGMIKDDSYKYFWLPDNHILRLFDMSATNSVVWIKASFKPLRSVTKVDNFLFEDWSEAIVAGAKWKILTMPGNDWTDQATGEFYRREWRKYLSQAKRSVVKGGSGQPDQVNWKSFGEID